MTFCHGWFFLVHSNFGMDQKWIWDSVENKNRAVNYWLNESMATDTHKRKMDVTCFLSSLSSLITPYRILIHGNHMLAIYYLISFSMTVHRIPVIACTAATCQKINPTKHCDKTFHEHKDTNTWGISISNSCTWTKRVSERWFWWWVACTDGVVGIDATVIDSHPIHLGMHCMMHCSSPNERVCKLLLSNTSLH